MGFKFSEGVFTYMKEYEIRFDPELKSDTQLQRIVELYQSIREQAKRQLNGLPNFPTDGEAFFQGVNERLNQFVDDQVDRDDPHDRHLVEAIAAAFIVECRVRDIPATADEISELVNTAVGDEVDVEKSRVMKRKREFDQLAGEWTQPPSPEVFIDRFADELDVHPKTLEEAVSAIGDVEGDNSMSGMNPSTTAAAALWVGARRSGEPIRQQDILEATGVGESQLRKRTRGIEATSGYVKLIRTVDRNITVPTELIEWLDISGKHIEWPLPGELEKAEYDDDILLELPILDEPSADSEPIGETIPVPKAVREHLPKKICWGWDSRDEQDLLLLREP